MRNDPVMHIQSYSKFDYQVLRITEDLTTESDLTEINQLIKEYSSLKNVAIQFTPKSCLYTDSIFMLTQCYRILAERGGELAVLNPNDAIRSALQTIGLANIISVYDSEDELQGKE